MKLEAMMEKGYKLRVWSISKTHGERRIAVKLSRTTSHGERFYMVHSPQVETILSDVEFTEPILIKG
jgi:hypothetical protein